MIMITLSLIANVAITFSVTWAIWRDTPGITDAFGADTPARRILACVYLAIGVISLLALIPLGLGQSYHSGNMHAVAAAVAVLLAVQIVYKLMTVFAVGPRHPVVMANLAVVVLHTITLVSVL